LCLIEKKIPHYTSSNHLDCIVEAQAKVGERCETVPQTSKRKKEGEGPEKRVILQEKSVQIGAVVKTFKKQAHKQIVVLVVQAQHYMQLV
jgi:ketopantoate reductase